MNKNIRIFIYVSLFVHLFGGVALYMYYFNPSAPQPLGTDRAEEPKIEKDLESLKVTSPPLKDVSRKKRRQVKNKTLSANAPRSRNNSIDPAASDNKNQSSIPSQKTDSSGKNGKVSLNSTGTEKGAQKLSKEGTPVSPKIIPPSGETGRGEGALAEKTVPTSSKAEDMKDTTQVAMKKAVSSPEGASVSEAKDEKQQGKSQGPLPNPSIEKSSQITEVQKTDTKDPLSSEPEASVSEEGTSKNPLPTQAAQEDGKQKTTPTVSVPNQEKSLAVKDTKEQPASPNVLKHSSSSSKFRDFLDLKQKRGNPKLDYPHEARKQKVHGRVSIIYFVDPEGLVDKIQLEKTSGHSVLDNFVLRTMARYEFLPHQEGWVRHTVDFILKGEEEQALKFRNKD